MDFRTVSYAICRGAILPTVPAGIGHFESSFHLLQSDASRRTIIFAFREIAVEAAETQMLARRLHGDMYETGLCGTDAMFEGIFHQRNEDERCNRHFFIFGNLQINLNVHIGVNPQLHQGYIALDKLNFLG